MGTPTRQDRPNRPPHPGWHAGRVHQMAASQPIRGTYGAVEYFERAVDIVPITRKRCSGWRESTPSRKRRRGDPAIQVNSPGPCTREPSSTWGCSTKTPKLQCCILLAACRCFPDDQRAMLYLKDIESAHDMYYDEETPRNQRAAQADSRFRLRFQLSVRSRNCLQKMAFAILAT